MRVNMFTDSYRVNILYFSHFFFLSMYNFSEINHNFSLSAISSYHGSNSQMLKLHTHNCQRNNVVSIISGQEVRLHEDTRFI